MSNDFNWPAERYQQSINPVKQYIDQAAKFLSIQRGIAVEKAKDFIQNKLKTKGATQFSDPSVVYFERNDNWIRELKTGTLSGYLKSAIENREVIVPTMTTYLPSDVEESLVSVFMKRNAGRRGTLKKKAQIEEFRGNKELAYQLNNEQDNAKRNNNSMSGVMAAAGSIFENPTGHNTLTSMTRSMSSISNALNERMISGNRHYNDPAAAINNMTAIAETMDVDAVRECILEYGLHVPTAEEIGKVVSKSSDKYWRDKRHIQHIINYAAKMTPEQRVAFAYTQDLYHIRKFNPEFMRKFIDNFAVWDPSVTIDDPLDYLDQVDPLITNYAHQVFISRLKGQDKDKKRWDPELVMDVARVAHGIERGVQTYKKLIDAFLIVRTVPNSSAFVNHMNRESVVLSDTDSTMFSIDEWVIWYFGELRFSDFAFAVAGSIMFISTQIIAHGMAILSANMNVAREKLFVLSMKPEFVFPVFAQTPVAKHYFCSMSVKEGAVYENNKYEIKGVHLKSSASPEAIVTAAQTRMKYILELVQAGDLIDQHEEITRVADLERMIIESVRNGESKFLKKMFMNVPGSYALGPTLSPFRFHTLWNTVFAPSYVEVEYPPYTILKLPITISSKKTMNDWLMSMEDTKLADRFRQYLLGLNRTEIKTLYISQDYVQSYGIPREIQKVLDVRKVVLDLTVIDRMVLATIGAHLKVNTLASEMGY